MAVTFLASSLVAVAGTAVLGARWTARAAITQESIRVAEHVLDSLAVLPEPAPGASTVAGLRAEWSVSGRTVHVEVSAPPGPVLVVLTGPRVPPVPALPDAGSRDEPAGTGGVE